MKRLIEKNINTPEEYYRIFQENKVLTKHDLRRLVLLQKYFKGGNFIDLGCLDSPLASMVKGKYPSSQIWGLDFVPEVIEYSKKFYSKVNYIISNVYDIPFQDNFFDYITAGELIEHLESPRTFIKEAMRILKPGGVFALSTPLEETNKGEVDGERHLWSFSRKDIYEFLEPYGNVRIRILGSEFVPRYKYHFPIIISWVKKYDETAFNTNSFYGRGLIQGIQRAGVVC